MRSRDHTDFPALRKRRLCTLIQTLIQEMRFTSLLNMFNIPYTIIKSLCILHDPQNIPASQSSASMAAETA
ncbi:hypothetical protein D3C78_1475510 [compost metagenome]